MRPASPWDGHVVVVSGTPWDGPWSSERQLAEALTRHRPVLWVDPPVSMLRAGGAREHLRTPRLRQQGERLARLTTVTTPGVTRPGLRRLALRQQRRAVRQASTALGGRPGAVLVASLDDLLDVLPSTRRVFYGTDDFVAGAGLMGLDPGWVARAERRQLSRADTVLAVSPALVDRWTAMGARPVLLPNGTDVGAFGRVPDTAPADDVRLPRPVAGFVGHISERIDLAYLEAVAERGVSLLLVGPVTRNGRLRGLETLLQHPHVLSTGHRPFAELPRYYRHLRVGLTPYADTAFNRASCPLKTLEYLAAGLRVVSSDLPASRALDSDLVVRAGTPAAFADAVQRALATPVGAAEATQRRLLARQHSWERRAEQLLDLLAVRSVPAGLRP
jgi:teichuronic acid biosynthesis glycosyltransferase TuaH